MLLIIYFSISHAFQGGGYRIKDTILLELAASVLAGGEHLQELPGSGATSDPKDTKKYYGRGNIPNWISPAINEVKNVETFICN